MKLTCSLLEDFEWAVANRNMITFRSVPCMHLIHALSQAATGYRLVCGVYNTRLHKGVVFDNPLDYAKWTEAPEATIGVFTTSNGDELFLLNVEDGNGQPTNHPA